MEWVLFLIYDYNTMNILFQYFSLFSDKIIIHQNHLACAEYANVDVLLTVDKKFKNNANRIPAKVKVMSPTEWLLEVIS